MTTARAKKGYRENVAAVVLNSAGLILACERSDLDGAWQFPQGGIDKGEAPGKALLRELQAEIGTSNVEILARLPHSLRYDFPPEIDDRPHRGQEQTYFLVRLNPSATISLTAHDHPEFKRTEWVTASEFLRRLTGFKSAVYSTALREFQRQCPGVIAE